MTKVEIREATKANRDNHKLQGVLASYQMLRVKKLKETTQEYKDGFWEGYKLARRELKKIEEAVMNG